MRPSFHPRLVNNPFDDPGLFIPFLFQNRALLFDLGDISALTGRDLLKVSHIFVTHTHMDHFIGFDHLLRLMLGREKTLSLYGPLDFIQHVEGKLSGYNWNLADKYNYPLVLEVTEVRANCRLTRSYRCRDRFKPLGNALEQPFEGQVYQEPAFNISAAILDHQIPSLGLSLRERFHVNIIKEELNRLGLEPGPWLADFKQAIYSHSDPAQLFIVTNPGQSEQKQFVLGDLTDSIARISPGQKITYISDAAYSQSNQEKIIDLARDSDHLFIEAVFLEQDRNLADRKHHLTARQAGTLAARAGVRQFSIFHFSPRYADQQDLLHQEAREAFERFS
ncbi:MAG: ribonuclease Z [Desulfobacterales bacterium]|jgi:ribonuclease Z